MCLLFAVDLWLSKPWFSASLIVAAEASEIYVCVWCATRTSPTRATVWNLLSATVIYLMMVIGLFAQIYRYFGVVDSKGVVFNDSANCWYFSLITWTTVGYGDFVPSPNARLIAATEAMFGYVFMGLSLATIFQLLLGRREQRESSLAKTPPASTDGHDASDLVSPPERPPSNQPPSRRESDRKKG